MKFKCKTSNITYDKILDAIHDYCVGKYCVCCDLFGRCTKKFFDYNEQKEIAKIIGLEIIEEEKPLEEWTLKEVKEECESHRKKQSCDNCKFSNSHICGSFIYKWNLNEKRKFTKEEIYAAKSIIKLYRDACKLYYREGLYIGVYTYNDIECMKIPHYKLPSIKEREVILIKDILGDENG